MKRDMDLIRTLLLSVEEQDRGLDDGVEILVGGVEPPVVKGHLRLLKEAGLINAHEGTGG